MIIYIGFKKDIPRVVLLDESLVVLDSVNIKQNNILAEKLLIIFDDLISKNKINKSAISKIAADVDAESYTGSRIIITTANLLGFCWDIPVVPVEKSNLEKALSYFVDKSTFDCPILPIYKKEPNITKPKARL